MLGPRMVTRDMITASTTVEAVATAVMAHTMDTVAMTDTEDPAVTTGTGDTVAMTDIGDPPAPMDIGDVAAMTDTGDPAVTTGTGDTVAITDIGDPTATTDIGDPAVTTDIGDSAATTDIGDTISAMSTMGTADTEATITDMMVMPTKVAMAGKMAAAVFGKAESLKSAQRHARQEAPGAIGQGQGGDRPKLNRGAGPSPSGAAWARQRSHEDAVRAAVATASIGGQ